MSDRIVVMNAGVAEQIGDPFEIYNRPATAFVATFVGTVNSLRARVTDPATGAVTIDGQPVTLGRPLAAASGSEIPSRSAPKPSPSAPSRATTPPSAARSRR